MKQKKIDMRVADVLERIRLLRISKKISVENLATKANVSRSYLYYIETKKKIPTLAVLLRIADALDVTVEDFFCPCFCPRTACKKHNIETSSGLFNFLSLLYTKQKKTSGSDFLSWKELYLLLAVRQNGSCSISSLSENLDMSELDISRTISDLQARNILLKEPKSSDHRIVLLSLSDTGRMLLEKNEQDLLTCLEKEPENDLESDNGEEPFGRVNGNQDRLICSFKPIFNNDKEISDLKFFETNRVVMKNFRENRTLLCSTLLPRTIYYHFDTVMSVCNTVWKMEKMISIVLDTEIKSKKYACEFSRTSFDCIIVSVQLVQKKTDECVCDFLPYYNFISGSRPAMITTDCATGKILEVNEAAVRFYGWSRHLFLQKTVYEISTTSAAVIRSRLEAGGANGSDSEQLLQVVHRFADKSTKQVNVHISSCVCDKTRIQYAVIMKAESAVTPLPPQIETEKIENKQPDSNFSPFAPKHEVRNEDSNELFKYMKKVGKLCKYSAGNQFYESSGTTLPMFGFILDGLFRVYYETFSGREYTLEYLRPGDIIDSLIYSSYLPEYEIIVEAIVPCSVLVIEQTLFKQRAAVDPYAFEFLYNLTRKRLGALGKHVMLLLTNNANDRYGQFIHEETDIIGYLRGQEIASYLGITPETLSRIRNTK